MIKRKKKRKNKKSLVDLMRSALEQDVNTSEKDLVGRCSKSQKWI